MEWGVHLKVNPYYNTINIPLKLFGKKVNPLSYQRFHYVIVYVGRFWRSN